MDKHDKAGDAFDESADRRPVSSTHEAIPLPMPDLHPGLDLDRSISDHRHSGEPATAFQALDPASAPPAPPFGRTG
ncbi:MAG: hypothetical protein QJR12_03785 [Mycobacterium sp.]|nr:hypothetical protein [Mycobacterium sp.]MDI3313427.1 hypothetical protein [Mycobacterium sp.]